MTIKLAKQLKDAKFPFRRWTTELQEQLIWDDGKADKEPTLSELIKACGNRFDELSRDETNRGGEWLAIWGDNQDPSITHTGQGQTPEEAVAKLWLQINKK